MKQENTTHRVKMIKRKKVWVSVGTTLLSLMLVGGMLAPTVVRADQTVETKTAIADLKEQLKSLEEEDDNQKKQAQEELRKAELSKYKNDHKTFLTTEARSHIKGDDSEIKDPDRIAAVRKIVEEAKKEIDNAQNKEDAKKIYDIAKAKIKEIVQLEVNRQKEELSTYKDTQKKLLETEAYPQVLGGEIKDIKRKTEVLKLVQIAKKDIDKAQTTEQIQKIFNTAKGKIQEIVQQEVKFQAEKTRREQELKERIRREELRKEELRKEELRKEELRKEELRKEELRKEELRKEELRKEELRKEELRKEELRKEELRKEELRKEELRKEELRKEELRKEELRKEELRKEELRKEELRKEELRKEELRKDELRKDELRKDELRKDELRKEELRKEQERKAEEARKEQERKAEESRKAEELRQQEEERKALHTFKLDETVKLKAQAGMHYDSLKTPELKAELKESIVKAVAAIREASSKADVQKIVSDATAKLKDIVSRSMNLSQDKHEDLRQQEEAPKTQDMNDSQQDDSNQIITFQDPATKVSVSAKKKDFNGAVGVRVVPMRAAILGQAPSDSYDITLVDAKGELVQPTGPVTVTAPANGIVDKVYYVLDDMKESLPFTLNANGTVSFGVTHFSVYAIFYKQAMNDTKSSDKSTPKGDDKVEQKSEPKEHMKQEQKRSEVAPKSNANQKEPKVTHGIARKMTPSRRSNQLPRTNSEETSLISIMMSALGVAGILSLVAYVMKRRR